MKYLLLVFLFIGFVSANIDGKIGLDLGLNPPEIVPGANYTINVNNTDHFGGYSVTEYRTWLQSFFDGIYCKLTGCQMTGNIDMGQNNITAVKMINLTTVSGACDLTAGAGISKNSTHYCFA